MQDMNAKSYKEMEIQKEIKNQTEMMAEMKKVSKSI